MLDRAYIICIIVVLVLFCSSCSWREAHFWRYDIKSKKDIKYSLKLPIGCKCAFTSSENSEEKTYTYPDSAYIFILDESPPSSFTEEIEKYGDGISLKIMASDTITISGTDKVGRLWELRKKKNLIYGYRKVAPNNKTRYDLALNSIKYRIDLNYSYHRSEQERYKTTYADIISVICRNF